MKRLRPELQELNKTLYDAVKQFCFDHLYHIHTITISDDFISFEFWSLNTKEKSLIQVDTHKFNNKSIYEHIHGRSLPKLPKKPIPKKTC